MEAGVTFSFSGSCSHIRNAETSIDRGNGKVNLSPVVLNDAPFPPLVMQEFNSLLEKADASKLIQRVSEHSLVVQTTPSAEAPLGLLHVRIDAKKVSLFLPEIQTNDIHQWSTNSPKVVKAMYTCVYVSLGSIF